MKTGPTKPYILITNDDGINAPGIKHLVEAVVPFADVAVVAPAEGQSGMSHAITIRRPLRLSPMQTFAHLGVEAWIVDGTPVDCVKMARHHLCKNRVPNLVLSGINHGSNSSVSTLYSGTMAAATEAGLHHLPAIGFSLCDYNLDADFSHIIPWVAKIAQQVLTDGLPPKTVLNVNFPAASSTPLKGIKLCRQAHARWVEAFEERKDPNGHTYFWLTGNYEYLDQGDQTDEWALQNNYISVVPCTLDHTNHQALSTLQANSQWA